MKIFDFLIRKKIIRTSDFLKRLLIGNVYIFSAFKSHSEYLAQLFKVNIRVLFKAETPFLFLGHILKPDKLGLNLPYILAYKYYCPISRLLFSASLWWFTVGLLIITITIWSFVGNGSPFKKSPNQRNITELIQIAKLVGWNFEVHILLFYLILIIPNMSNLRRIKIHFSVSKLNMRDNSFFEEKIRLSYFMHVTEGL